MSQAQKMIKTTLVAGSPGLIKRVDLRRVNLPLSRPYRLSYRTFENFEPIVVQVTSSDGRVGWGDGHISPGSSTETREGGWAFCQGLAARFIGTTTTEAMELVGARSRESKVAATALATALEALEESSLLDISQHTMLPLLTPVNGLSPAEIDTEVTGKIEAGFRCFKVKVGKDVEADLKRVAAIQAVVGERATLRLDANRGFTREQGISFASSLDPRSIELFEQPCPSEDWDANAAVARASTVPLCLDEPICGPADIRRAAEIPGVGFCKLKLKRFGSLGNLCRGLDLVRELGMEPVLGDGLGSELSAWMEACAARLLVRNAGEFNGFLKLREGFLETPLRFEAGCLILPQGFKPSIDRQKLDNFTQELVSFS